MTRYGPLDLLGTIGRSHRYENLLQETKEIDLSPDVRVRVLNIERLIEVKLETAGEKDLAMLPILRRTLEEKKKH